MPRSRSLVLLAALTCAGTAFAAAWSSFSEAFPAAPCSDGWAGCVVANATVNAAPQHDAAGRPLPADARLGWFDLEPTAAFSPFVSLSTYAPGGAPVAAPSRLLPHRHLWRPLLRRLRRRPPLSLPRRCRRPCRVPR
jgi:hypothetical protein